MKYVCFLCCLVFLLIPTIGSSEEGDSALPQIVVAADRIETSKEDITQDVVVITRKEIEDKGSDFITDVLRGQSGLAIVQNGGPGKNATMILRGGAPNQVVIMVDGVKLKSPTTGSVDLSGILVDDIERIEIVKGPQSTMYGSEAMSGVVNIITRKGSGKPKVTVEGEAGSFSTYKTALSLSGSASFLDYNLTGSYYDTSGISAARSGTEDDGYTSRSVSANIGATPSEKFSVRLKARYSNEETDLDGYQFGTGLVDDLNFTEEAKRYLVSAQSGLYLVGPYEQMLTVSRAGEDLSFDDPDDAANNTDIETVMDTVDWQHNLYLDPVTFTAGAEYRKESGENKGNFDETIQNRAVYLNGKVKMADDTVILNGGLRYDDHEHSGNRTTYRAGALYRIKTTGSKITANYGTGYRAPTLNELFFPFFGNLDLKPEKSKGFDIGAEQMLFGETTTLSATYFEQRYDDLIQYDFVTFSAQNIGRAQVKGFDLGAAVVPVDHITLRAFYTHLETEDRDTGQPLTRRPRHKASSSLQYDNGSIMIMAEYLYVARVFDAADDRRLEDYSLVNLKGRYVFNRHMTLFARIDNLLDEDYEEAAGYGTPGFSAYGGVKVSF